MCQEGGGRESADVDPDPLLGMISVTCDSQGAYGGGRLIAYCTCECKKCDTRAGGGRFRYLFILNFNNDTNNLTIFIL